MKRIFTAIMALLAFASTFAQVPVENPKDTETYGLVCLSVATMRTRGAHAAEMDTQAVMGTPVRIVERDGSWLKAECPEGHTAWVPASSVKILTSEEFAAWRASDNRYVVTSLWQTNAYNSSTTEDPRDVVTDLVLNAIVEAVPAQHENGRMLITLPDGRKAYADCKALTPLSKWAKQEFDVQKILTTAHSLMGAPYLWGGTSCKSVDCSGLVKVSYLNNGVILLRNASQQARIGKRLEVDAKVLRPGDLLFFTPSPTSDKITHVAIYEADEYYIHSAGSVRMSSINPESPDFDGRAPVHGCRIDGQIGTEGIIRVENHSWYFNQ